MKPTMVLLTVLLAAKAMAGHDDDRPINLATELRDWCKEESEAALIGRGMTPANWTASYFDRGNELTVKGQWRVAGSAVGVECHTTRGAKARFASLSILDGGAASVNEPNEAN